LSVGDAFAIVQVAATAAGGAISRRILEEHKPLQGSLEPNPFVVRGPNVINAKFRPVVVVITVGSAIFAITIPSVEPSSNEMGPVPAPDGLVNGADRSLVPADRFDEVVRPSGGSHF
jgi:hypothetical protein